MAQLKDTVISGSLRVTDTIFSTNLNLSSLTASYAVLTDANKNLISRAIYNRTSVGDLEWTAAATDVHLITKNTLAYWNGRYNSSTSNLAYCNKGAFGNAVTYGVDDATANGALGTGTNLTTERSVYYGLVIVNNASQTRATSIYAPTSAGTANQILVSKGGTSAPEWKATANGAAYATSSNGALTFGTLPTAQGGTGNSSYTAGRLLYTNTATKFATSDAAQFDGTNMTLTGTLTISNTTAATSTTTGALRVSGGLSTGAASYLTGSVHIVGAAGDSPLLVRGIAGCGTDGNRDTSSVSGKSLYLNVNGGPVYVGKTDNTATNQLIIAYTTHAESTATGALTVAGGVGINENLYVGGYIDSVISSDLTANNNNVSNDVFNGYYICDSGDRGIAYLRGGVHYDGHTSVFLGAKNYNGETSLDYKGILINRTKTDTVDITLDGPTVIKDSLRVDDTIYGSGNAIISSCVIPQQSSCTAGWRRVCLLSMAGTGGGMLIFFGGSWHNGAPTSAIVALTMCNDSYKLGLICCERLGMITQMRLVNVNGYQCWLDVYMQAQSATVGAQRISIMGAGAVSDKTNSSAVFTDSVTASATLSFVACSPANTANTSAGGGGSFTGAISISPTGTSNTTQIGSLNAQFCHIYNSANIPFIFNNDILFYGKHTIGSTLNYSYNPYRLYLCGDTANARTLNSGNPFIEFADVNHSQYAQLIYTDYDAQGGSDSFTFVSNQSDLRVFAPKVHGAVWNDYAECRKADTVEPGYCVTEQNNGCMTKTTERLMPGCKLISDTYGMIIGETETAKTPIAVTGRALAYPYRNINEYHLGDAVCSAPDGKIDIMTREEIMTYPERIIGTVSEIPTYKVWKAGQDGKLEIEVKGRIWIYVK